MVLSHAVPFLWTGQPPDVLFISFPSLSACHLIRDLSGFGRRLRSYQQTLWVPWMLSPDTRGVSCQAEDTDSMIQDIMGMGVWWGQWAVSCPLAPGLGFLVGGLTARLDKAA